MRTNRLIMNVIISSLIGISLGLMIKAVNGVKDIQSNTIFIAELSSNVLPGQIITVESLLSDMPNVKKNSVQVVGATQALEEMKIEMPELAYMADNPFRDIITFKTVGITSDDIATMKEEILALGGVADVYYDEELLALLPQSSQRMRIGMIMISIIVLLGSIVILGLRVKRDLRAYKEEASILTLAGAKQEQIVQKRMSWSIKWGSISAALAVLITVVNITFINNTLLDDLEITFLQSITAIAVMIVTVIGVHALVTYRSMTSYLTQINPSIRT